MRNTKLILLLTLFYASCSSTDEPNLPKTTTGEINSSTSFYTYQRNLLYTNLASIIPNTPLYGKYFADAYNARAYADFDKDGDIDVMAVSFNYTENTGIDVEYYQRSANGFEKNQTAFLGAAPQFVHGRKMIVGDYNADGWPDVVIAGHGYDKPPFPGEPAKLLLNINGKFSTITLSIPAAFYHSVCAGDVDQDGDADLFLTNNFGSSKYLKNDGKGAFTSDESVVPTSISNKGYFTSEFYDINADGFLDLITTGHEHEGAPSTIFWGGATYKFSATSSTVLPSVSGQGIAIDIDFLDYDKDGKLDVLLTRTADGSGALRFYQGYYLQLLRGKGNTFEDVTSSALINASDPAAKWLNWVRVHDINNDGNADITSDDQFYNLQWIFTNGRFEKR